MACTSRYLDKCIPPNQRKIVENELYGANKLYDYLCNNLEFQKGTFLTKVQMNKYF